MRPAAYAYRSWFQPFGVATPRTIGGRGLHNALVANQTNSGVWEGIPRALDKSRWARLPFWTRMTIGAASILVPPLGAGIAAAVLVHDRDVSTPARPVAGASASAVPDPPGGTPHGVRAPDANTGLGVQPPPSTAAPRSTPRPGRTGRQQSARDTTEPRADDSPPGPRDTGTPATSKPSTGGPAIGGPVITKRQVIEEREIPYRTRIVRDRSLAPGEHQLWTPGENGIRTLRYEVTTVDGRQIGKRLVDSTLTKRSVTRIIGVGGRPEPGDPTCVPDVNGYGCG
jgi:hypothetical protein